MVTEHAKGEWKQRLPQYKNRITARVKSLGKKLVARVHIGCLTIKEKPWTESGHRGNLDPIRIRLKGNLSIVYCKGKTNNQSVIHPLILIRLFPSTAAVPKAIKRHRS